MLLSELLQDFTTIAAQDECEVVAITADSRAIKPGELFIAYSGCNVDGRNYIAAAISAGAVAVIAEKNGFDVATKYNVPVILIADLLAKISLIAARFYDFPSKKMTIIGVTGTNGKTSCSQYVAQALTALGKTCAVIGTMGAGFLPNLIADDRTTPDPIALQKQLAQLQQQGAEVVAMEVSSHGLAQHRVDGVDFAVAIFTNLTRDHLDYHKTMAEYAAAKKRLFAFPDLKYAVINADDDFGQQLINEFRHKLNIVAYSLESRNFALPAVSAENIVAHHIGYKLQLNSPWGRGEIATKLIGRFNLSNLLAAIAVLNVMGVSFAETVQSASQMQPVVGRMQLLHQRGKPHFVIDYAHTPDALAKALQATRDHCHGKLWVIFGCGGDRDRGKRPMMAEVAEKLADQVIITDDNPRTEDPRKIVDDIIAGFKKTDRVYVAKDRVDAIEHAAKNAAKDDMILVAGKGHEDYQVVGTDKIHYSDIEQVKLALGID